MYMQMRLRKFRCPECNEPFKSTSPNALRCQKCSLEWSKKRNREYQKRRLATKRAGKTPAAVARTNGRVVLTGEPAQP
jgi:tRNA(Ile2) C34 agmatinyltransferase TiaS